MNQHMTVTTELQRQHEAHKAIRARLWGSSRETAEAPKAKITTKLPRMPTRRLLDADSHVVVYRQWRALMDSISKFSTATRIQIDCPSPKRKIPDIIADVLVDYPWLKISDIMGNRRSRDVSLPRQLCHYAACVQRPDLSRAEIARRFNRDHSTILHSVEKIKALKAAQKGTT